MYGLFSGLGLKRLEFINFITNIFGEKNIFFYFFCDFIFMAMLLFTGRFCENSKKLTMLCILNHSHDIELNSTESVYSNPSRVTRLETNINSLLPYEPVYDTSNSISCWILFRTADTDTFHLVPVRFVPRYFLICRFLCYPETMTLWRSRTAVPDILIIDLDKE